MATVSNAIATLRLNNTPFWWLSNGSGKKVGQYLDSSDLDASISKLNEVYELLPDGTYTLKASDKEQNHSGANHFTFSKSSKNQPSQQSIMQQAPSTNVYGIPDHILKTVQENERFKMLVENMSDDFKDFMKEWPEYKKKIDYCYNELKDDDNNGIPDVFEMAKKATEVVKAGKEMKGLFK